MILEEWWRMGWFGLDLFVMTQLGKEGKTNLAEEYMSWLLVRLEKCFRQGPA